MKIDQWKRSYLKAVGCYHVWLQKAPGFKDKMDAVNVSRFSLCFAFLVSNKLKFLRDIHWPDLKAVMVSYLFDFNNEDLDVMDFYTTKSLTWE